MNGLDLRRENTLNVDLKATFNPFTSGMEGVQPFLDALEAHAGEWMPTTVCSFVRYKRPRKYSHANVYKAVREEQAKRTDPGDVSITLTRLSAPEFELHLSFDGEYTRCWFRVLPFSYFQDSSQAMERSRRLMEIIRAWALWCPPIFARVHDLADLQLAKDPTRGVKPDYKRLENVFWLNVLGKPLVSKLGRKRVLSTPAHLVEELPNGAVLIVAHPSVGDVHAEAGRLAQARALCHLRPDLSFDEVRARLNERSAALVPVPPNFHPDVAELFHWILDYTVEIDQRPRRITELNAYRPPPVDEWLPREALKPSDVPNQARRAAEPPTTSNYLIQEVVRKLKKPVQDSPEILPSVDFLMWYSSYPGIEPMYLTSYIRNAGWLLGDLLVRHLGGTWVPRRIPEECQVLLGDRVYLPLLRARHCLESDQSIIDHSLNQFYREAERHARAASGRN